MNATSKVNSTQYRCAKFKEYVTQLHKYFHRIVVGCLPRTCTEIVK